jgi:hypothetical protein
MIWLFTFWCHAAGITNPYCSLLGKLESQEFETEQRCVKFANEFLSAQYNFDKRAPGGPFLYEYSCKLTESKLYQLPVRREE